MKGVVLVLLLLLLVGCQEEIKEELPVGGFTIKESVVDMTMSTDKDLYHSSEIMKIDVEANSKKDVSEAVLKVYGVYAGRNRMDEMKVVSLKEGVNNIEVEYMTPSCTSCSGIKPGNYTITAEITCEDTKSVVTKEIEIRK